MLKAVDEELNWEKILVKFNSYEGKIIDFCKENNISHHQLYYRRKRAKKESQQIFHAITLNENCTTSAPHIQPEAVIKEIKIEIGKATIYIPSSEEQLLSKIIKEITISCLI